MELNVRPVNLKEELRESLFVLLGESAKSSGITFECRVEEGLPEVVLVDLLRLEQIVDKLVSNAFKFTNAGGKVTLHISSRQLIDEQNTTSPSPSTIQQDGIFTLTALNPYSYNNLQTNENASPATTITPSSSSIGLSPRRAPRPTVSKFSESNTQGPEYADLKTIPLKEIRTEVPHYHTQDDESESEPQPQIQPHSHSHRTASTSSSSPYASTFTIPFTPLSPAPYSNPFASTSTPSPSFTNTSKPVDLVIT
ncbi:hypothetical protein HK102_012340, partial [Quaeritorhiza haematococci]